MAHFAQSPSFILHQVTCQFATGDTLFGPLNLTLEPSLCALVGRNGSGKRVCCVCWRGWMNRLPVILNALARMSMWRSSMYFSADDAG
jgi:hypothetical protein